MSWFFGASNPGLRQDRPVSRQLPPTLMISLKAYPALYVGREDLESGNKILLPPSVLHNLSQYRLPHPMMFVLQNTMLGNSTNVGVLEFTAHNGLCILPNWLFEQLNLDYGAEVNLLLQVGAPKGKFVKLQPHKTEFIELPDPRAILERNLSNYVCLTKGDTIQVKVVNKVYLFDVLEVKPLNKTNCICLIEADIEVDFAPPLDYVEKPPELVKRQSSINLDEEEQETKGPFSGKGIKINGQVVEKTKEKVSNEEYDPRKHKLPNGIRANIFGSYFKGEGIKIGETRAKLGGTQLGGTKPVTQPVTTKTQVPGPQNGSLGSVGLKPQTVTQPSGMNGMGSGVSKSGTGVSGVGKSGTGVDRNAYKKF